MAVKGIHIINANQFVDKIVMFFKPFMNAKLRNMVRNKRISVPYRRNRRIKEFLFCLAQNPQRGFV